MRLGAALALRVCHELGRLTKRLAVTREYQILSGPIGMRLAGLPKAANESFIKGIAREEGRNGISANSVFVGVIDVGMFHQLMEKGAFPLDWFEATRWPEGRHCCHCGGVRTREVPDAKPIPCRCKDCRSCFSVRAGTTVRNSRLPFRKWAFAVCLSVTHPKGVSSMKLHRDLKVTQQRHGACRMSARRMGQERSETVWRSRGSRWDPALAGSRRLCRRRSGKS